jgi:hypothetical protein
MVLQGAIAGLIGSQILLLTYWSIIFTIKKYQYMEIIHIILGKANPDRLNGVNKVVYNLATEQTMAGKKHSSLGV